MRPILDGVVSGNILSHPDLADMVFASPMYEGNAAQDVIKSVTVSKCKSAKRVPIIQEIINTYGSLKLEDSYSFMNLYGKEVSCNINLVRFVESCIIGQINVNPAYSNIICDYVRELMSLISENGLSLPVAVPTLTKFEEIVVKELNDFLLEICEKEGISYSKIVATKKSRKKSIFGKLDELCE